MIKNTLKELDHPTAAELYEEIRKAYPQISLGTVYRNLNSMADAGEILRISFPDIPDRYDPNIHEHCHVACVKCGKVFDTNPLPQDLINQIAEKTQEITGVKIIDQILFLRGVCKECRGMPTTKINA
ncbi:MAG: Fur family transcriptional regulator, peroxide stress response regulator [Clostridiales bacterium]|jgi:Fur family peroxide stress response transcriptional regulator|nr:Fur family transcriptional regulator, peroxide stress response regulator [Clostridiales bacterium]